MIHSPAVPTAVPDDALCLTCNYALRGLDARRCPECGRAFDPDDPMTMNVGRPLDRVAKALLRPTGRWGPALMWTLAVLGVLGPAWLVPSRIVACLWLLLWGAFMVACWGRALLRYAVVVRYRQPPECLRIDDPFRWRARRAFVLVTLLILTRAPFILALLVSRPWLDREARYVWTVLPASVQPSQSPKLCGLVIVQRIDAGGAHVTFHLLGGGQIGYRTSPDGQDVEWDWETYGWFE